MHLMIMAAEFKDIAVCYSLRVTFVKETLIIGRVQ